MCCNQYSMCDLHLTLCHNHIVLCDRSLTLCHNQIVLHDFPVHLITILVFCLIFSGLCDGSALCYNYNPITPSGFGLHFKIRFLQSCHPLVFWLCTNCIRQIDWGGNPEGMYYRKTNSELLRTTLKGWNYKWLQQNVHIYKTIKICRYNNVTFYNHTTLGFWSRFKMRETKWFKSWTVTWSRFRFVLNFVNKFCFVYAYLNLY